MSARRRKWNADDWDEHLNSVTFAYRVNVQESTKYYPFELMYGIRARLPLDIDGTGDTETEDNDDPVAREKELSEPLKVTRQQAKANIAEAQGKQKKRFDLKHRQPTYKIRDMVLRYNARLDTRMGDKLEKPYTGPFQIIEEVGRGVYRLQDGDKPIKQVVNTTRLKLWHTPGSPEVSPLSKNRFTETKLSPLPNTPVKLIPPIVNSFETPQTQMKLP